MKRATYLVAPLVAAALLGVSGTALAGPAPTPAAAPVPGPAIPDMTFGDVPVVVTSPGDPATAVGLRPPLNAGATARSSSESWDRGSETYRNGSEASSSDFESTLRWSGRDEVVEARPDGSSLVRFTSDAVSLDATWSNPDHVQDYPDYGLLSGSVLLIEYGPARQSSAAYQDPAAPLTPEQIALVAGNRMTLGSPAPAEPVGVGAVWTWTSTTNLYGMEFAVPMTTVLISVDGGRYTTTTTFSFDLAAQPVELPADGSIASVAAGVYEGTIVTDGSLSDPLDVHERRDLTYQLALGLADGWTLELQGATTDEYWETPDTPVQVTPVVTAAPVTAAPVTEAPVTAVPVADTVTIVDDLGLITVTVPASWTQVRTEPVDGRGRIVASPDLSVFSPTSTLPRAYTVPGVLMLSSPTQLPDAAESVSFLPFPDCQKQEPQPYADAAFTGATLVFSACGGTASEITVFAGNRNDGTGSLSAIILDTVAGSPTVPGIIASLGGTPAS